MTVHYKLSKTMKNYLRKKMLDPDTKGNKTTINALKKRKLCFEDGSLTEKGTDVAISLLPLSKQCYFMNIPLEDLVLEYYCSPEEAVFNHLVSNSKLAYITENTFGVHVAQFFMFKHQYEIAVKYELNLYSVAFTANDYTRKFIYEELLNNLDEMIKNINADTIDKNYQLIQTLNRQHNPVLSFSINIDDNYQVNVSSNEQKDKNGQFMMTLFYQDTWDINFYKNLYSFLGLELIQKFIKFIISNPSRYAIGWPDIIVLEKEPYFIEVKTTDRFHISQIITMKEVLSELNIPIQCVRVKKVT